MGKNEAPTKKERLTILFSSEEGKKKKRPKEKNRKGKKKKTKKKQGRKIRIKKKESVHFGR